MQHCSEALFNFACVRHIEAQKWAHEYGDSLSKEQKEELNEALKFEVQLPQVCHSRVMLVLSLPRTNHSPSSDREFKSPCTFVI